MGMTTIRRWRGEQPGKSLTAEELKEQEAKSNAKAKGEPKQRATKKEADAK